MKKLIVVVSSLLVSTAAVAGELLPQPATQYAKEGDAVTATFAVVPTGVRYEVLGLPRGLALDAQTGAVTGAFDGNSAGQYVVTLRASSATRVETITFTWVVLEGTLPQIASPGVLVNQAGTDVTLQLQASDADGDALTLRAAGLPRGLALDAATGVISGRLEDHELRTTYVLTVSASDGHAVGGTVFTWIVLPNE